MAVHAATNQHPPCLEVSEQPFCFALGIPSEAAILNAQLLTSYLKLTAVLVQHKQQDSEFRRALKAQGVAAARETAAGLQWKVSSSS
jgi:hypothetical protein